jgi:hypothetical protein
MSLKTIKVNPIFLANNSVKANKTRKEKPSGVSLGQSNNIKKKLIARIKNFQQNSKKDKSNISNKESINDNSINDESINDNNFCNEFNDSMSFLDNLARDKEEHKITKRNSTLKKKHIPNPDAYMQIATELPPELDWNIISPPIQTAPIQTAPIQTAPIQATPIQATPIQATPTQVAWNAPPQPSYSNLKNSSTRPTYRNWLRNTQKNKNVIDKPHNKPNIKIFEAINSEINLPTQEELMPTAQASMPTAQASMPTAQASMPTAQASMPTAQASMPKAYTPSLPKRKKITRTIKYKLGKHANGKVSVLIKNAQTRRKIQTEQAQLKRKSILDIIKHLRSKNLLKVGSEAPNDVLREIYEQSILAGQIENKSKDTLIHNYFNDSPH